MFLQPLTQIRTLCIRTYDYFLIDVFDKMDYESMDYESIMNANYDYRYIPLIISKISPREGSFCLTQHICKK